MYTCLPGSLFASSSQHDPVGMIRMDRLKAFRLGNDQLIQGIEISLGAGNDDICICPMTAEDARVWNLLLRIHGLDVGLLGLDSNRDFTDCIDALCDRVNVELQQGIGCLDDLIDRFISRVYGSGSHGGKDMDFPIRTF